MKATSDERRRRPVEQLRGARRDAQVAPLLVDDEDRVGHRREEGPQFRLRFPDRLLRLALRRDVLHGPAHQQGPPVLVAVHAPAALQPAGRLVARTVLFRELVARAGEGGGDRRLDAGAIVGVDGVAEGLDGARRSRPYAEQSLGVARPDDSARRQVPLPGAHAGGIQSLAEALDVLEGNLLRGEARFALANGLVEGLARSPEAGLDPLQGAGDEELE